MLTPFPMRRVWAFLCVAVLLAPLARASIASSGNLTSSRETERADSSSGFGADAALPTRGEPSGDGPWVVRAYYTDRQMVDDLAAWREPWEVHHDQGYIVLDVTRSEYARLLDAGFRLEIEQGLTAQLYQPSASLPGQTTGIPGYSCYRTVEETYAAAEAIVADHSELATWTDIGDSWEKTEPGGKPGYDMMVLRLTNSTVPGPKPKVFIMASVHAREYTPAELVTRFAQYVVNHYGSDPDITWLLDYRELHILLQANPDGRKWAEGGDPWRYWRKNTNNNYCTDGFWPGADLNRNFEFQWGCCGGSSGDECSEVYRGPSPASEPETQAIQDYVRALFPDQRQGDVSAAAPITATGIFLDIHSYGQLVMWPWGAIDTPAPNSTALQTLGRKFAFFNQYTPQQGSDLYLTDGASDGFAYGELGLATYTFELGTAFFQDCFTFEDAILRDNLPALIYAAKVARTPYLTPAGPDALNLIVVPEAAVIGETVQLTATIDDSRYSTQNGTEPAQNIVTAEYYIDVPPGTTTTVPISHPMTAEDGVFDAKVEEVQGSIDTASLNMGRHTIFVRGQDAQGNWGTLGAIFLHVGGSSRLYLPLVAKHH